MGLKNYALNSGKDETYAVNYADNNIDKYAAKIVKKIFRMILERK